MRCSQEERDRDEKAETSSDVDSNSSLRAELSPGTEAKKVSSAGGKEFQC